MIVEETNGIAPKRALLQGQDLAVAAWAFNEFNLFPLYINRAFGIVRDGSLVGAVIFREYNGTNVYLSVYTKVGLTRSECSFLAHFAVNDLKVERVSFRIPKNNKKHSKRVLRWGAKVEATSDCFYGRERSSRNVAVQYVFFKETLLKLGGIQPNKMN